LCDNALTTAWTYKKSKVNSDIVHKAVQNWKGRPVRRTPLSLAYALLFAVILGGGYLLSTTDAIAEFNHSLYNTFQSNKPSSTESSSMKSDSKSIAATVPTVELDPILSTPIPNLVPEEHTKSTLVSSTFIDSATNDDTRQISVDLLSDSELEIDNHFSDVTTDSNNIETASESTSRVLKTEPTKSKDQAKQNQVQGTHTSESTASLESTPKASNSFPVVHRVSSGENLTTLCQQIYGKTTDEILQFVIAHNSEIRNKDYIITGTTIVFPKLPYHINE